MQFVTRRVVRNSSLSLSLRARDDPCPLFSPPLHFLRRYRVLHALRDRFAHFHPSPRSNVPFRSPFRPLFLFPFFLPPLFSPPPSPSLPPPPFPPRSLGVTFFSPRSFSHRHPPHLLQLSSSNNAFFFHETFFVSRLHVLHPRLCTRIKTQPSARGGGRGEGGGGR